jgi:8-oxo-dGTP diphosphatase
MSETFAAAALREVREETGLTVRVDGVLAISEHIEEDVHIVFVTCAATWIEGIPEAPIDDAKITAAQWVDTARAMDLLPSFPVTTTIFETTGLVPHFSEEAT